MTNTKKFYNNLPARVYRFTSSIPRADLRTPATEAQAKAHRIAGHNSLIWRTVRFTMLAVPFLLALILTGGSRGNGDR